MPNLQDYFPFFQQEQIDYLPGGSELLKTSITAVVDRSPVRGQGSIGVHRARVAIQNDAVAGVASVNPGSDQVRFVQTKPDGVPTTMLVTRIITSDRGVWYLEVTQ